jgi:myo-inositol-1(or 4)-monophosphatase
MSARFLRTAKLAAWSAGKLLRRHYGKLRASQIRQKSRNDFVTELDKASEKLILSIVRKDFPKHSIQAEESGLSVGDQTRWIIDPLDGTSNYIHQFPMFAVSIGVEHRGRLVAGVVYDPIHNEMFSAEKGRGSFLNDRRFRVSSVRKLKDALMSTGIPFRARNRFHEYFKSLKIISLASAGMRRGGSAALDLAYVACGRFDGFWEINLSPWDIAAGAVLIHEAGGRVTDVWGKKGFLLGGDVLASNKKIHPELVHITGRAFTEKRGERPCNSPCEAF